jgi:citrate synthase
MMLSPDGVKIWRPRQLFVGAEVRDYVDIEDRKAEKQEVGSEPTEVPHLFSKRAFLAQYKDKKSEARPSKL